MRQPAGAMATYSERTGPEKSPNEGHARSIIVSYLSQQINRHLTMSRLLPSTLLFCILAFLPLTLFAQSWKTYPYHQAGSVLNFPADEGHHPDEPIEWWYTNARVTGLETGTEYSFMLTYFYYPAFTFQGFRIFNLANEDTGEFFDETRACTYPLLAQDHLEIQADLTPGGSERV